MATFPKKTSIPVASGKKTKKVYQFMHETTQGFFKQNVLLAHETTMKENGSIGITMYMRADPMPVPTLGLMEIATRAFFVPYRKVFPAFYDFVNKKKHIYGNNNSGYVSYTPGIDNSVLLQMYLDDDDDVTEHYTGNSQQIQLKGDNYFDYVIKRTTQSKATFTYEESLEILKKYIENDEYADEAEYICDNMYDTYEDASVEEGDLYNVVSNSLDIAETYKEKAIYIIELQHVEYVQSQITKTIDLIPLLYAYKNMNYQFVMNNQVLYTGVKMDDQLRTYDKILRQLGYRIIPDESNTKEWSALPLLSLVKIVYDWYLNDSYIDGLDNYTQIGQMFTYDWYNSRLKISFNQLWKIMALVSTIWYDKDYFTSAFDYPTGTNVLDDNNINLTYKVDSDISLVANGNGENTGMPEGAVSDDGNYLPVFSQWLEDAVKKIANWVQRNRIVGNRTIDRFLARYGVVLNNDELMRCEYLGEQVDYLRANDVMCTNENEYVKVGDYAGKAEKQTETKRFEYDTNEFGMLLILNEIKPRIGYYQGVARHCMHSTPLSFWVPEFDKLSPQEIQSMELYVPTQAHKNVGYLNGINNKVFGFTKKYAEYSSKLDMLTGDFSCESLYSGLEAWHFFRKIENTINAASTTNIAHSEAFTKARDSQYQRVFYNAPDYKYLTADTFKMIVAFDMEVWNSTSKLFDDYDFGCEEQNERVTVNVGGPKIN